MSEMKSNDPCEDSDGDCHKATTLVDKFIDNILEDSERLFIERHLSNCPGCSHGFEFESMFHIRMKSVAPISMPSDVKENILLALGFPGMSNPMKGAFSAMGSQDAQIDEQITDQMGIPKGDIPKGTIPKSGFFGSKDPLSGNNED